MGLLQDIGVAAGGLLGPRSDAYAAGLGGVVASNTLKLKQSLLDRLRAAGAKWGSNYGGLAQAIPGAIAEGAAGPAAATTAAFESKYLGMSMTQMIAAGAALAVGGVWLLLRRR